MYWILSINSLQGLGFESLVDCRYLDLPVSPPRDRYSVEFQFWRCLVYFFNHKIMINNSSKEDFSSKKMYKFRVIKSCFNGNVYKSYCWQGIKFEVFLLEISAKIIGNILADVSTKNRQNGEAKKSIFWNGILILNLQNVQSRKPLMPSSQAQFPRTLLHDPFSLQWLSSRQKNSGAKKRWKW